MEYRYNQQLARQQRYNQNTTEENNIGQFMDEYFWSKVAKVKGVEFKRFNDTGNQYAGVDLQIGNWKVDEKDKGFNSLVRFPSVELSFINKAGYLNVGWFWAENHQTTHYCYITTYSTARYRNQVTKDNITSLEAMIFKKEDLEKHIYEQRTHRQLVDDVEELRNNFELYPTNQDGKYRINFKNCDFCITYSDYMDEKPINLVFDVQTFRELPSTITYKITKERVTRL